MKRNNAFIVWIVSLAGLLCSLKGGATDVNSAEALRNALTNATESNGVVTLSGNVSLGSTLRITGGTMVLNLNGYTLTYDRTGNSETALAINVEGDGANVIIKNGTIEVRAAKGEKGGFFSRDGKKGNTAICIQLNKGISSLMNITLIAKPGEGGDPYKSNSGNKGDAGDAYTIDPNTGAMGGMIANGAYVAGASANDYNSEGYPGISTTSHTTTISLVTYTVAYNANGGTIQTPGASSYTIETANFSLPTAGKTGYTLNSWKYNNIPVDVNNLPATNSREATQSITFDADWKAVSYKITYNTNGGNTLEESSYTIESESIILPVPVKDGSLFQGWYTNPGFTGQPVTTIPKGSTGDKAFYAKWLPSYSISYELNGGTNVENPPLAFTKESETITLPVPTRKGYSFAGWFADPSLTGTAQTEIAKGSSGDRTYYAKWSIINYKLNYHSNGGDLPATYPQTYTVEEAVTLPTATRLHYTFAGWYKTETGNQSFGTTIPKGTTGDQTLYARWTPEEYTVTLDMQGGDKLDNITYNLETDRLLLPTDGTKRGYTFVGWYKDAALTQPFGTHIEKGTSGNFTLYAKWTPTRYAISYDCYHGTNPSDAPTGYTIQEAVVLPIPHRPNFSFIGWYATDELTGDIQTSIPEGSVGDRTFYAKWGEGNLLSFTQPEAGKIAVTANGQALKSGTKVGAGTELTVTATSTNTSYTLSKLVINDQTYTSSPQTVKMPAEGGLTISALFLDPRPAAAAPEITTFPENSLFIPSGEQVTVTLKKSDPDSELFYSLDGSTPQPYTAPFIVSSHTSEEKTVQVTAYARKEGHKEGVTTRDITFRGSRITISFELPKGITAIDPDGGDVISAVASGGTFRFKLRIDREYFPTLDSVEVIANGLPVYPNLYGIYTLGNQSLNVVVTVKGITGQTYRVALEQTPHGEIFFTDEETLDAWEAHYGDQISITAKAIPPYKFLQWEDGSQTNPRMLTVEKNQTIKAYFTSDQSSFLVVLPQIEGVTVKPLTGYAPEVLPGGKFKCYLQIDPAYNESEPIVKADGEVLTAVQQVYSVYNIQHNIRISVEGIRKNDVMLTLKDDRIEATDLATGEKVKNRKLKPGTLLSLYAKAPEGKVFAKWNDGKADNPRILPVEDAPQMIPLFDQKGDKETAQLIFNAVKGAGISPVNANIDALAVGENIRLRLILSPAYSQCRDQVRLGMNGKTIEPELSLRAASQTETLYYTFPLPAGQSTLEVTGLKLNRYTLKIVQPQRGSIQSNYTSDIEHGTLVTLTARPAQGDMFKRWNDGNTVTPYTFEMTGDREIAGTFIETQVPLSNESMPTGYRLYATPGTLHAETTRPALLSAWNIRGELIHQTALPAGHWSERFKTGIYVVKLGEATPVKINIK